MERAINFYDEIISKKMIPTEEVYVSLIHACAGRKDLCILFYFLFLFSSFESSLNRVDNYNKAFEFFQKMKEDGFHPNIKTYTALLLNSANRGDYEVFKQTKKQKTKKQIS